MNELPKNSVPKGNKYGVAAGLIASLCIGLIPNILGLIDMSQNPGPYATNESKIEYKNSWFHNLSSNVGCYGQPAACGDQSNSHGFIITFVILWFFFGIFVYYKSKKMFSSPSERKSFLTKSITTFAICLFLFSWTLRIGFLIISLLTGGI